VKRVVRGFGGQTAAGTSLVVNPRLRGWSNAATKIAVLHTEKLVPQPQEEVATGLLILNEEPIRSST
jgi:hypothetical protein